MVKQPFSLLREIDIKLFFSKRSGVRHMSAAKRQPGGIVSGKVVRVVIIFKENHTFDNYFGTFPGANGMIMPRSPNPPPSDPDNRHGAWLIRQTTSVPQLIVESAISTSFYNVGKVTITYS